MIHAYDRRFYSAFVEELEVRHWPHFSEPKWQAALFTADRLAPCDSSLPVPPKRQLDNRASTWRVGYHDTTAQANACAPTKSTLLLDDGWISGRRNSQVRHPISATGSVKRPIR
jgi:hypothetical protein